MLGEVRATSGPLDRKPKIMEDTVRSAGVDGIRERDDLLGELLGVRVRRRCHGTAADTALAMAEAQLVPQPEELQFLLLG